MKFPVPASAPRAIFLLHCQPAKHIGMNQIRPGEKCRMATDFDETW